MTVESALYPQQLNTAWPQASDMVSEGDNHIRLTKTVIKTTFPNVAGVVSATDVQLSYVTGVTSAIQAQIDSKGAIAGQTWTGAHVFPGTTTIGGLTPTIRGYLETVTSDAQAQLNARALKAGETYSGAHNFTGAAVTVPTATAGDSTSQAASTAFVTGAVGAVAATQVAAAIHAATSKTTPADADELGITDSAASWGLKKLTFANLKAWIGGLFVSKSGDTINGNLDFSGTGRRITGDFSNATWSSRLALQTSTLNGNTGVNILPNGTSVTAALRVFNNSNPTNAGCAELGCDNTIVTFGAGRDGSGAFLPLGLYAGGIQAVQIGTTGNVLVTGGGGLGYGVGSSGTVTQLTSKTTGVVLNKPGGVITMHDASLAAGATASFQLTNSSLGASGDVLVVNTDGFTDYRAEVAYNDSLTIAVIRVTNIGATRSDALRIKFAVIKGSAS